MALENYVKFLRGTPQAYQKLTEKNKDTLYFISENNASTGILYLGDVMIAGGELNAQDLKLNDLQDILISEGLAKGDILSFNGAHWVNSSLSDVLAVMQGASETQAGVAGLVPAPQANQHNLFLRGDGVWADAGVGTLTTEVSDLKEVLGKPAVKDQEGNVTEVATGVFADLDNKAEKATVSSLQTEVSNLQGVVGTLVGTDTDKSVRTIATEVLSEVLIPENASESLDTLQEISA